jgi:hypothetical protein
MGPLPGPQRRPPVVICQLRVAAQDGKLHFRRRLAAQDRHTVLARRIDGDGRGRGVDPVQHLPVCSGNRQADPTLEQTYELVRLKVHQCVSVQPQRTAVSE